MGDHPANGHPRKAARLSKASDSVRYPQGFLEGWREAWIPRDDSVGQEYCVGQVSQETTRTKYDGDVRLPLPPSLLPVPMDTLRVRMMGGTLHCSHFFATMDCRCRGASAKCTARHDSMRPPTTWHLRRVVLSRPFCSTDGGEERLSARCTISTRPGNRSSFRPE